MGRDGTGWDGMGRDGMGWDGTRRDAPKWAVRTTGGAIRIHVRIPIGDPLLEPADPTDSDPGSRTCQEGANVLFPGRPRNRPQLDHARSCHTSHCRDGIQTQSAGQDGIQPQSVHRDGIYPQSVNRDGGSGWALATEKSG